MALVIVMSVTCKATEDRSNCKCFEEFEPEKEDNNWFCRGKKNFRIFSCGEQRPPLCVCKSKDKDITLDIGETNCFKSGSSFDEIHCSPKDEWDQYYQNHPHRRIYN